MKLVNAGTSQSAMWPFKKAGDVPMRGQSITKAVGKQRWGFLRRNGVDVLLQGIAIALLFALLVEGGWVSGHKGLKRTGDSSRRTTCLTLVNLLAALMTALVANVFASTFQVWFNFRLEKGDRVSHLVQQSCGPIGLLQPCFSQGQARCRSWIWWVVILQLSAVAVHVAAAFSPSLLQYQSRSLTQVNEDVALGQCALSLASDFNDANSGLAMFDLTQWGTNAALGQFVGDKQLHVALKETESVSTMAAVEAAIGHLGLSDFAPQAPLQALLLSSVFSLNQQPVTLCSLESVLGSNVFSTTMTNTFQNAAVRFSLVNTTLLPNTVDASQPTGLPVPSDLVGQVSLWNSNNSESEQCQYCWGKAYSSSEDGTMRLLTYFDLDTGEEPLRIAGAFGQLHVGYTVASDELVGTADVTLAFVDGAYTIGFSNMVLGLEDHMVTIRGRACEFVTSLLSNGDVFPPAQSPLLDLCLSDNSAWNAQDPRTDSIFRLVYQFGNGVPAAYHNSSSPNPSAVTRDYWRGLLIMRQMYRAYGNIAQGAPEFYVPEKGDVHLAVDALSGAAVVASFAGLILLCALMLIYQEILSQRSSTNSMELSPFMLLSRLPVVTGAPSDLCNDPSAFDKWTYASFVRLGARGSSLEISFTGEDEFCSSSLERQETVPKGSYGGPMNSELVAMDSL